MRRLFTTCLLTAALLAGTLPGTLAGELATPSGPVILTIAGAIENSNRGASDPLQDRLLAYHDRSFAKAAEFDIAMLERLGMKRIRFGYKEWPQAEVMEGPLLRDVLAAAGATGQSITALALDGYGADFTRDQWLARDYVVVLKRNGRYLRLGALGPALLAFDRDQDAADKNDDGLVYAMFYIDVH